MMGGRITKCPQCGIVYSVIKGHVCLPRLRKFDKDKQKRT
jgi:hypothetical protein